MKKFEQLMLNMLDDGARIHLPRNNDEFQCKISYGSNISIYFRKQVGESVIVDYEHSYHDPLKITKLINIKDLETFLRLYPGYIERQENFDVISYLEGKQNLGSHVFRGAQKIVLDVLNGNIDYKLLKKQSFFFGSPKSEGIELTFEEPNTKTNWTIAFEETVLNNLSCLRVETSGVVKNGDSLVAIRFCSMFPSEKIKNYKLLKDNVIIVNDCFDFNRKEDDLFEVMKENVSADRIKAMIFNIELSEKVHNVDQDVSMAKKTNLKL